MNPNAIRKAAIVGSYIPRRCGIATFTESVASAVESAGIHVDVVAVNDRVEGYDYPENVRFQIDMHRMESYEEVAACLNSSSVDVVGVQHEYGIYGGPAGSYLIRLLRGVNAPIVTTLHTILENPDAEQREVMDELSYLSEVLVVMSERGKRMLQEVHGIHPDKVMVIPHGIPSVERYRCEPYLKKLGFEGKRLILTFGLISPDKGIEDMIGAMPAICEHHPDTYYLVVGVTHPNIRSSNGETYRKTLGDLVVELGLEQNVGFVDEFVDLDALSDYLLAADIYVTPYLKREQITSGTLAYAYGSGKAVVSTPYWHAEDLLAGGRGILVPFRDSTAISNEICQLLSDPERLDAIQARAFEDGQQMRWPVIASEYVRAFQSARDLARSVLPVMSMPTEPKIIEPGIEVEFSLDHLDNLTDDTGILQHSTHNIPNRFEGYCTDDNARLAIVGARMEGHLGWGATAIKLQQKGLSFIHHAFNSDAGRMRNFMNYDRSWTEEVGSEDCHGRALWALGVMCDEASIEGIRAVAKSLFLRALPAAKEFTHLRSIAFSVLGLDRMLSAEYCSDCLSVVRVLGGRLFDAYKATAGPEWKWFEDVVTYDNARLPQALMAAGCLLEDSEMIAIGKVALQWLSKLQSSPLGCFLPIGSSGFYRRGGQRAFYDQQPLEAAATIDACLDAFRLTGDAYWRDEALRAQRWFFGANSEGICLIDEDAGGCKDGLMDGRVNQNQGAESMLSFISSCLSVRTIEEMASRRRGSRYMS